MQWNRGWWNTWQFWQAIGCYQFVIFHFYLCLSAPVLLLEHIVFRLEALIFNLFGNYQYVSSENKCTFYSLYVRVNVLHFWSFVTQSVRCLWGWDFRNCIISTAFFFCFTNVMFTWHVFFLLTLLTLPRSPHNKNTTWASLRLRNPPKSICCGIFSWQCIEKLLMIF